MAADGGDVGLIDHVRASNLVGRFFLELVMLAATGVIGFRAVDGGGAGVGLAIAGPVVFGLVWGAIVAPKARFRLPDPARLVFEAILFGAIAWALVAVDLAVLGVVLGAVAGLHLVLMVAFGQRGS